MQQRQVNQRVTVNQPKPDAAEAPEATPSPEQPAERRMPKSALGRVLSRGQQRQVGAQPLEAAAPEERRGPSSALSWLTSRIKGAKAKEKEQEPRPATGGGGGQPPIDRTQRLSTGGGGDEERPEEQQPQQRVAKPRTGSSAGEAVKLDPTQQEFQTYMDDMASNTQGKAQFFTEKLRALGDEPKTVLDFGTCGAELPEQLTPEFPQHKFLGLDLSKEMLLAGKRRMEERGLERMPALFAADGFHPPLKDQCVDVVTMSSFFHELFSYSRQPHTVEGLEPGMREIHRILKDDGTVIIRDPAKPENPEEPVYLKPFDDNGINPPTLDQIKETEPKNLSTRSLLHWFCDGFAPARRVFPDGVPQFDEQGRVQMPAWLASEFIRHRTLVDTKGHWESEMLEQYGVFTRSEMRDFAQQVGFEHVDVDISYNPKNHSAGYGSEMTITDLEGRAFEQSQRFPTQITAVLSKKAPDSTSQP